MKSTHNVKKFIPTQFCQPYDGCNTHFTVKKSGKIKSASYSGKIEVLNLFKVVDHYNRERNFPRFAYYYFLNIYLLNSNKWRLFRYLHMLIKINEQLNNGLHKNYHSFFLSSSFTLTFSHYIFRIFRKILGTS